MWLISTRSYIIAIELNSSATEGWWGRGTGGREALVSADCIHTQILVSDEPYIDIWAGWTYSCINPVNTHVYGSVSWVADCSGTEAVYINTCEISCRLQCDLVDIVENSTPTGLCNGNDLYWKLYHIILIFVFELKCSCMEGQLHWYITGDKRQQMV